MPIIFQINKLSFTRYYMSNQLFITKICDRKKYFKLSKNNRNPSVYTALYFARDDNQIPAKLSICI